VLLEPPPDGGASDNTARFVFSYSPYPTNDGYFWQFGPLGADRANMRKIHIGEYSRREKYRLFTFVPTEEAIEVETGGKVYYGEKHWFEGIPIRKAKTRLADTLELQVHSKGFPTFVPAKEPFDGTKPVARGTLLNFARGGNGAECLLVGWSQPEAWGVWSERAHAALAVLMNNKGSGQIMELVGSGFLGSKCPQQRINVRVNGVSVGQAVFDLDHPEDMHRLRIPAEVAQKDLGRLLIDFSCENAISPKVIGTSEDRRELALALRTLRISDDDSAK
jgi:hypothetical protein